MKLSRIEIIFLNFKRINTKYFAPIIVHECAMTRRLKDYYIKIRAYHLYFGLFISPFIVIFAISVLAFNHPRLLKTQDSAESLNVIRTKLDKIPYDTTDLGTAKAILKKLDINGEIDFISKNEDQISFPVNLPGLRSGVVVNTHNDSVLITCQPENYLRAMSWLHLMPGQHNAAIRGNSHFMKIWRIIADAVVYVVIFLLLSGVYLWYFVEIRRLPGLYAILLGMIFFAVVLFLVFK
jgi:hypothetical protein